MKLKKMLLAGLIAGATSANSLAATITAVRSWRAPDNTRLVLDLSETVRYRQLASTNGRQLVIELDNTDTQVGTPALPARVGLVQGVQFQTEAGKLRLVISLSDEVRPHVFTLPANDKYSPRLVIDLYDKVVMQPTEPAEELETVGRGDNGGRPVIVVVDAGHGGEDSGAIGASGHYEKHVTLAIARKLVNILRTTDGFKAYLTRDDDYFIPLQDRRKIARNRYKADIFISIHADSAPSPLARGASVFALSRKGATTATSRFAQALAEKENKSDLIGGVDQSAGRDSQLTTILADMVVEGSLNHSLQMGGQILGELENIGTLHARHIEQAGFAVLKEPGMISVLVETGFISNPDEELKLTNPADQQRIAQSVFNGVRAYMQRYPMPRTYFAWQKEQRGRPKARALQAVAAGEPRPLANSPERLLDASPEAIKQGGLIHTVADTRTAAVLMNATEARPAADAKSVAAVVRSGGEVRPVKEATAVKENVMPVRMAVETPRPASPAGAAIPIESHSLSAPTVKPEPVSPVHPAAAQTGKPAVAATLPTSLDDFIAGAGRGQHSAPAASSRSDAPAARTGTVKVALTRVDSGRGDGAKPAETRGEAGKAGTGKPEAGKVAATPPAAKPSPEKPRQHTVAAGDTLSSIASQYRLALADLKAWNGLKDDKALLGTVLRLTPPGAKQTASTGTAEKSRP